MDTATKTAIDAAKTKSGSKNCRRTGDLTGNKIADKITSVGKSKEKKEKTKKVEENYIPPEKKTTNN